MNYKEETVWSIRNAIYIAIILSFILLSLTRCSKVKVERSIDFNLLATKMDDIFWPPDMIPHPRPLESTPSDGNA